MDGVGWVGMGDGDRDDVGVCLDKAGVSDIRLSGLITYRDRHDCVWLPAIYVRNQTINKYNIIPHPKLTVIKI